MHLPVLRVWTAFAALALLTPRWGEAAGGGGSVVHSLDGSSVLGDSASDTDTPPRFTNLQERIAAVSTFQ